MVMGDNVEKSIGDIVIHDKTNSTALATLNEESRIEYVINSTN